MKYYLSKAGELFGYEADGSQDHIIPSDQREATDAEVAAIQNPSVAVVPFSVSPAQARLALLAAGLLDQVEAAVAAGDRATQIAWEMATVIERSSPTVAALSTALGLTDAQLDALFTTAAAIRV